MQAAFDVQSESILHSGRAGVSLKQLANGSPINPGGHLQVARLF